MVDAEISIIIVNFNCGELLTKCVRSALASSLPVEVFVSDNGSSDGSIGFLQQAIQDERLHIIENGANLGFARANNMVLALTRGQYILFLNPDCVIEPTTIAAMLDVFSAHPKCGMSGCLIRNPDGSEQAGCRRRVPTPARSMIRMLNLDKPFPILKEKGILLHRQALPSKAVKVEAISGAFMLVRREALEDIGPMDEAYFLHCEDLDWYMRFRQQGWNILFVPDIEVIHHQGTCSNQRPVRVEWHKHKGMVRFYRKFFRHQYPLLLMCCVMTTIWSRFLLLALWLNCRRLLR